MLSPPPSKQPTRLHRKPLTNRLLAGLLAAALVAGCGTTVRNPVTGQTERTVMDEADEVREGAKAHTEILKERND